MDIDALFTKEYNKGFRAGRMFAEQQHDDQFWLRTYAGRAMQGILAQPKNCERSMLVIADNAVRSAQALLAEVKRVENEQTKCEVANE